MTWPAVAAPASVAARKTAAPPERRNAARTIAGGAFYTSAGGQKGLKAFGTWPSTGTSDCAHKAGDGTNA